MIEAHVRRGSENDLTIGWKRFWKNLTVNVFAVVGISLAAISASLRAVSDGSILYILDKGCWGR